MQCHPERSDGSLAGWLTTLRVQCDVSSGSEISHFVRDDTFWQRWHGNVSFSPYMPKFFIKTYGCQMNERDSEQVAHSLITRGYERATSETEADVVLLNTCSVRDMADQKAIGKMGMLGRVAKDRPHVVFGFLGCMAQARGESLLKNLPHVDLVVGTQKFHRVADYVEELIERKTACLAG